MNTPRGGVGSVALVVSDYFLPSQGQLRNWPAFHICFYKVEHKDFKQNAPGGSEHLWSSKFYGTVQKVRYLG